ncbi:virulence-associated protein E [Pseudomonas duriflava]|uniref:Virulence-associated protein E n=1 Tax=Pseudomonas duriflava TaxID=459528 RepID=A0A562Q1D0_9PSED|nr:VapE domain-containing protein [Pseudomonas duriflava]TWI50448.1 virulence-associated protein E [Pseudomonas duriflava]
MPDWLKVLIVQGKDPDEPHKYASRSEALFAVACGLVRQGVPGEVIFSVLTDGSFGIAESVVENKSPEKYAHRQIEKAHEAVAQDVTWNPINAKTGMPLKSLHNTITALRLIGLECSYDLFRRRNMVGHHQMQELSGEFSDMAEVLIRREIRCRFGFDPGKEYVRDAVLELCALGSFDPLLDHLRGLPTWDGMPRLDSWLVRYLGAENSPYIRAAGATWLVAAMARAFEPGTKFDHMLVLVGAQGRGKSSALNILARDFFSDANFLGAKDTREVLEATEGAWIVECAELAGMRQKDVETLKHEITKEEDRGRPAYARTVVSVKRRFVLAGTTNSPRFLHDETGNRRFWPVEVGEIDLTGLLADRDQLMAEALARYRSGDFQLFLADEALEGAQEAQEARRTVEEGLLDFAESLQPEGLYEGKAAIRTSTVYESMNIPVERRGGRLLSDVRRAMEEAGWRATSSSVRWQGKKQRLYLWAKNEPPPPLVSAQPF